MSTSSVEKHRLIVGLFVAAGVVIFGLNGPWLFQRFGLNVPAAAALGTLAGAAVGACLAHFFFRQPDAPAVPDVTKPTVSTGLDDIRASGTHGSGGITGTSQDEATEVRIEGALRQQIPEAAADIRVQVRNHKVVLRGIVHSWGDEAEAEQIAFDMPGIQEVENRLEVIQQGRS